MYGEARSMSLGKLLSLHTITGSVDPDAGRWGIPHMYSEGVWSA